jgi:UDP-N-acetylmuramoyl-L-alanyl-D-glutamate--2,6-diaminopimelate ligase
MMAAMQPVLVARLFASQSLMGHSAQQVTGIARDSRSLLSGQAYFAIGTPAERIAHIADAISHGAGMIVSEATSAISGATSSLVTSHARWSFARASAAWHGVDRLALPLFGVTGTAGKSTITHCAWWALGAGAARIGTIGWHDGVSEQPNSQTTPPPERIHSFLTGLPTSCSGVAMELSSHAGDQYRLAGLSFNGLVFTGLGHDHLDYHRTTGAYLTAKLRLLRHLKTGAPCIINADDTYAHTVAHAATAVGAQVVMLGMTRGDSRLVRSAGVWRLRHNAVDYPVPVRMPGDFNAWNAAAGALLVGGAGISLPVALNRMATMPAVPGRLELLARHPETYVDYAHTPEELTVMLRAVRREFPHRRLVCVFGCGGDRDRSKRGPMGCAALEADQAVLTTDNSRSENPQQIADDVIAGLPAGSKISFAKGDDLASGRWLGDMIPAYGGMGNRVQEGGRSLVVELDRATAIRMARAMAGTDGVVVVAGKGHETEQIIAGTSHAWDDRGFVRSLDGGLR